MSDNLSHVIDLASKKPLDQLAWSARLKRNQEGAVLPTVSNMLMILANDVPLRGLLAYNAFTNEPLIMRAAPISDDGQPELPGPYPRQWERADVTLVHAYLERVWSPRVALTNVESAMVTEASLRQFHPVRDWLDDLVWDKTPRLDKWLSAVFGCDDTPFHRAAGAKLLIAAVRRVKKPGCKFDQMLVLEGPQGIGKSRALRALFGDAWFSDAIPPDLNSKDAALALQGVWGLEFAEIEHLIRAEVETIKAFLSRSVDRFRPPYGKTYVERPRQGVLIGTTNSDEYLRDASGNRRIWPVKCPCADPEWVAVNREQLWAEAVFREGQGEAVWLDEDEARQGAAQAQDERMESEAWAEIILNFTRARARVTVPEILTEALGFTKDKMNKAAEMRCSKVLRQAKWTRVKRRVGGVPCWIWSSPTALSYDEEPF